MCTSTAQDMIASYRGAMSRFTTGVAIVTTKTSDGPAVMTASAVASVSLDPLMALTVLESPLGMRRRLHRSANRL